MRSMRKGFHGELCSSDRSGKPDNLFENTRVEQTHVGSGQPDERNSSSAHTVKEQFAPEDNRDIALFNTDNEFNRAINEEDIDFNIPGVPHSAVKQLHGHALQSDLQQSQPFDPFSQESKDMIREVGNIELCELLDVEPKAQCMDKLADEDHTHHITPEEIRVCRNNWWIRSNTVGSDTMPVRHRP